jgi:starvation-inducible DNA-binding protein
MEGAMNKKEGHSVVKSLEKALADTYILYTKTQNYHWNYSGSNFYSLHKLFESQYEELAEAIDEIAERLRALGATVAGTNSAFVKLSSLKEDTKALPSDKMVKQLLRDHREIILELRALSALAEKSDDPATVDLMGRRLNAHEKSAWMLESTIS